MFPVAAIAVALVSPADERPVRIEGLKDVLSVQRDLS